MLTVYSAHGSPGASTTALYLAAQWASTGTEVLLIEADPGGGSLSHHLGIQFAPGTASFVASGLPVRTGSLIDHSQDVLFSNLHVMPLTSSPTAARDIAKWFAARAGELRDVSENDMAVIIDGGRITADSAGADLTRFAAGVVVVAHGDSSRASLEHLGSLLDGETCGDSVERCVMTVGQSPLNEGEWLGTCDLTFCGSVLDFADVSRDLTAFLNRNKRKSKRWRVSLEQVAEWLLPLANPRAGSARPALEAPAAVAPVDEKFAPSPVPLPAAEAPELDDEHDDEIELEHELDDELEHELEHELDDELDELDDELGYEHEHDGEHEIYEELAAVDPYGQPQQPDSYDGLPEQLDGAAPAEPPPEPYYAPAAHYPASPPAPAAHPQHPTERQPQYVGAPPPPPEHVFYETPLPEPQPVYPPQPSYQLHPEVQPVYEQREAPWPAQPPAPAAPQEPPAIYQQPSRHPGPAPPPPFDQQTHAAAYGHPPQPSPQPHEWRGEPPPAYHHTPETVRQTAPPAPPPVATPPTVRVTQVAPAQTPPPHTYAPDAPPPAPPTGSAPSSVHAAEPPPPDVAPSGSFRDWAARMHERASQEWPARHHGDAS